MKLILACVCLACLCLVGCKKESPKMCKLVMLTTLDPAKGVYYPHWHLSGSDIITKKEDKIILNFANGGQMSALEKDLTIDDEPCRR